MAEKLSVVVSSIMEDYSKLPLFERLTCGDTSGRPGFE